MFLLVFCLVAIAAPVAGQLQFNATEVSQSLKIRCSLPDMQSANMAHIISLGISKVVNGADEILVSILSIGGSAPIIGDLNGGVIDTALTFDGSQCYLEISWPDVDSSLAGEYKCTLNGLDQNNLQITLNENLQVSFHNTEPTFVASPHHVIDVGLTRYLTLNCSVTDFSSIQLSTITAIDLAYLHNHIYQQLATVSVFDNATASTGTSSESVSGYVGNNGPNYLEMNWYYPGVDNEGIYVCEVMGIDVNGFPARFSKTLDLIVQHPERQKLVDKIKELDKAYKNLTLQTSNTADSQANLTQGFNFYYSQYNNISKELQALVVQLSNSTNVTSQLQQQFDKLNQQKEQLGDYYIWACDFENDFCGLNQHTDDSFDWTRFSGPTDSTDTGPSDDHTPDSTNGFYIFLETSSGVTGDIARIETQSIPAHTHRPICVKFYYHMYGSNMGSLNIYNKHGSSLGSPVWSAKGNKGDTWLEGKVVLPVDSASSSVVFEAVRGSAYTSDIGLDDILISDVNC